MKKLMMALAVMTMGMTAFAQESPAAREDRPRMSTEERAKARTQRMAKDLGLSAEQLARVEALNLKHAKEGEAMRASDEKERAMRRAEMKDRKAAYETELKTVLTPEQFTKWEAKKDEMKAKHREKRMERRENSKESLERKED
jgi:hypothetical protein